MKRYALIGLFVMTVIGCTGCGKDIFYLDSEIDYEEWISPDGVHYWYLTPGYGRQFIPRYDRNGNLVVGRMIDETK